MTSNEFSTTYRHLIGKVIIFSYLLKKGEYKTITSRILRLDKTFKVFVLENGLFLSPENQSFEIVEV